MISCIIPTYKGHRYLKRAIDSVLNQTYKDWELIVVDDNNPDTPEREKTQEVMMDYNDDRIIYIKHKKNQNGSAARNTGLRRATGRYICFLDDDDFYIQNRFECFLNILEANPMSIGIISDYILVRDNNLIYRKINDVENQQKELFLNTSYLGTGSNIFLKSEVVEKVGFFDEKYVRNQDVEYVLRCLVHGKLVIVNKPLVVKTVRSQVNVPTYNKYITVKEMIEKDFSYILEGLTEDEMTLYEVSKYREFRHACKVHKDKINYKECTDKLIRLGDRKLWLGDLKSVLAKNLIVAHIYMFVHREKKVNKEYRKDILNTIGKYRVK